jgi:hypothetical protein
MFLGIDVGFSKKRKTTGIAWIGSDGICHAVKCGSDAEDRLARVPQGFRPKIVAIDGPLVPDSGAPHESIVRTSEQILSRGIFQRRCKPGFSHFGTGLKLRQAAHATAQQIEHIVERLSGGAELPYPLAGLKIVEAFPNAFLGVLLDDETFNAPLHRRKKSDAFYEMACASGALERVAISGCGLSADASSRMKQETDHEKRAAYICLLTAILVERQAIQAIGCVDTGWIVLPHRDLCARWSQDALDRSLDRSPRDH